MPPTDPRKPGLVGSQILPNKPSAMPTPRLPLDDTPPPEPRTRSIDEMMPVAHSRQFGKKKATTCRNTQKIGDTLFKCDLPSSHQDPVQHREKGRVIKDNRQVQYEVKWWDIPTEVIRAT